MGAGAWYSGHLVYYYIVANIGKYKGNITVGHQNLQPATKNGNEVSKEEKIFPRL